MNQTKAYGDYKILEAKSSQELESLVLGALGGGWQPIGGVSVSSKEGGGWKFVQALVLEIEEQA